MSLLDSLLVPYDGSAHSRAAAASARFFAGRTPTRVVLAHAVPPGRPAGEQAGIVQKARQMLEEEAALFTTPVEVRLLEGDPAPVVAAECAHHGLTIVGTRGRSVVAGLLLGSVARYLLRAVTRPVMVVHAPLTALPRVLVGVDPSPASVAVVQAARALADATKASLLLVHAVDTDPDVMRRPEAFGIAPDVWAEALEAHGEKVFQPLHASAGPAEERLVFGTAVDRIRHTAKAEAFPLVAVGRRGSSGLDVDAWFSVAFALAARGPFATLVV